MLQFKTLIRSRDSPLNIETLILVMFIMPLADAGVDKWLGGKCALYKQHTKNFYADNVCCIFEDNYIFVENLKLTSGTQRSHFIPGI